jgi:hypothetical protein
MQAERLNGQFDHIAVSAGAEGCSAIRIEERESAPLWVAANQGFSVIENEACQCLETGRQFVSAP